MLLAFSIKAPPPVPTPRRRSAIVVHPPPPTSLEEDHESTLPTFSMPAAYDADDGAERLSRFRRNPAVLVGAGVTAGVLGAGLVAFNRGDSLWSQRLMRMRVVAQVRGGCAQRWGREGPRVGPGVTASVARVDGCSSSASGAPTRRRVSSRWAGLTRCIHMWRLTPCIRFVVASCPPFACPAAFGAPLCIHGRGSAGHP